MRSNAIYADEQRHNGSFPDRIRRLRLRLVLTQKEAADAAEISVRTLQDWEEGKHVPRPGAKVRRLASLYRVDAFFLLNGDEEEE